MIGRTDVARCLAYCDEASRQTNRSIEMLTDVLSDEDGDGRDKRVRDQLTGARIKARGALAELDKAQAFLRTALEIVG